MTEKQLTFNRGLLLGYTAAYYNIRNRGVSKNQEGDCSYEAGCAIGQHLPKELCRELDKLVNTAVSADGAFNRLPEWMHQLGKDFLAEIQDLHDLSWHWTAAGLSEIGIGVVEKICNKFNIPFKNQ